MNETAAREVSTSGKIKAKVLHELQELAIIVAYLLLFFFAFATYRMMLLHHFRSAWVEYGSALVSAMVLSKVIVLGQAMKLGKGAEAKPLLYTSFFKALAFAILTGIFKLLEEIVTGLFHGEDLAGVFREMGTDGAMQLVVLGLVSFCVYVPFFALMETRRVLGHEKLAELFLRGRD